jgi:hypothetical protein
VEGREWERREERAVVGSKGDVGQLGGGEPIAWGVLCLQLKLVVVEFSRLSWVVSRANVLWQFKVYDHDHNKIVCTYGKLAERPNHQTHI